MSYQNAPGTSPLLVDSSTIINNPGEPEEDENETVYEIVHHHEAREAPSTSSLIRSRSWRCWKITRQLLLSPLTDEHGTASSVAVGLAMLFVLGTAIGLLSHKSRDLRGSVYPVASACIGYTYFLMWSVSFYPQVASNVRRGTTRGLSADFAALNVLGFACYTVYTVTLYYNEPMRRAYAERHAGERPTVQSNDVAFCMHALLLASITLAQIGYYDGFGILRRRRHESGVVPLQQQQQRPPCSRIIGSVIGGILAIVVLYPLIAVWLFQWSSTLDYLYLLSYVKIAVTLIKYIPQVILNFRRKSTSGWSIWQILLDFSGGVLSDTQLVLDCWNMGDFSGITGNLAKFFLGSVSIVFDIMFMLQHYVLYPHHRRSSSMSVSSENVPVLDAEHEPILEDNDTQDEDDVEGLTV